MVWYSLICWFFRRAHTPSSCVLGGGVVGVAHIFQLILVAFLSSLILFTPGLFLAQTNIRKRQNSFSDQISVCLSVYVTVCCE